MLTSFLKRRLGRFAANDRGYISTEAVIVLPVMLWLFGAGWVYFDAFHQQSVNQKANYVIGDMISRETDGVSSTYIDNAFNLLTTLTKSDSAITDMRTAVVEYSSRRDRWSVVWSEQRGDAMSGVASALTDADLVSFGDRLPPAMDNQQLVLVETWEDWEPAFDIGIGAFQIRTYSFTAPRYAPQIPFAGNDTGGGGSSSSDDDDTGNGNGWGNPWYGNWPGRGNGWGRS
ncbi:hypothetical protein GGQ68_002405 [Sagittula marina]|uniref:Pilus assembly protein n=1 Tax=Sagittula marina TaxID=943940 RepID=A0A7W6DSF6_9RHOB|nr:hypothetical protein [Sagittula marina]MBB3986067.1 hypothetical protein [Sagittula marina]